MDEIIRFVMLVQSARFTVSELCEQFGISRKTGYKHLERYAADGLKGLAVRSHRPHQFPQRTDSAVEGLILAERRLHRTWGPKKLHKVLEVKHGIESPPARSTTSGVETADDADNADKPKLGGETRLSSVKSVKSAVHISVFRLHPQKRTKEMKVFPLDCLL
jgi:hypothetical protein